VDDRGGRVVGICISLRLAGLAVAVGVATAVAMGTQDERRQRHRVTLQDQRQCAAIVEPDDPDEPPQIL
jgi:hypothetical protein